MNNPLATIQVHCPHCQHQQSEPEGVVSTNCRACGKYIRVSELTLKPVVYVPKPKKTIECIVCKTKIRVVESALSSICPNCSTHLNLQDYRLSSGDNDQVSTLGTVVLYGRRRYEGKQIQANRVEIGCPSNVRFLVRELAILKSHGEVEGKLEAPRIEIAPQSSTRARILQTPLLEVHGEIIAEQIRAKTIHVYPRGILLAKRIQCETVKVEPGGFLRGRMITTRFAESLIQT